MKYCISIQHEEDAHPAPYYVHDSKECAERCIQEMKEMDGDDKTTYSIREVDCFNAAGVCVSD